MSDACWDDGQSTFSFDCLDGCGLSEEPAEAWEIELKRTLKKLDVSVTQLESPVLGIM